MPFYTNKEKTAEKLEKGRQNNMFRTINRSIAFRNREII